MGRLQKRLNQKHKLEKIEKKEKTKKDKSSRRKGNSIIPVYNTKGKTITPEKKRRDRILAGITIAICAIVVFLYVPQYLPMFQEKEIAGPVVQPDSGALKRSSSAVRQHTGDDFDNDGITNADEEKYGTNLWNPDTDNDGAYDVYEINVSKTDPTKYDDDVLIDYQGKMDDQNGKKVSSPYAIENVILWAKDYQSKAHGSVVKTTSGAYHFCGFNGYAQFVEEEGMHAYSVEDGVHKGMVYVPNEKVWKITGDMVVELYEQELEEVIDLTLFGHDHYFHTGKALDFIEGVLPDKGFIAISRKMRIDVEASTEKDITTDIKMPVFDTADEYRFTINTNTLQDLRYVHESIAEKKSCIAVSLYNDNYGEYLGIVYGYTPDGDLLIADMDTAKPIGSLKVTEKARKVLDQDGTLLNRYYFDFDGLGFHSANGDRIAFFAASSGAVNNMVTEQEETEEMLETETTDVAETETEVVESSAVEETAETTVAESTKAKKKKKDKSKKKETDDSLILGETASTESETPAATEDSGENQTETEAE